MKGGKTTHAAICTHGGFAQKLKIESKIDMVRA
jgi:hypothetical protein